MNEVSTEAFKEEILVQTEHATKKTILEPLGIVLALLPQDFPVLETVNCLIPAILAGNAILLKDHPSSPTLAPFFEEAL